jgi:hypothetical protein
MSQTCEYCDDTDDESAAQHATIAASEPTTVEADT